MLLCEVLNVIMSEIWEISKKINLNKKRDSEHNYIKHDTQNDKKYSLNVNCFEKIRKDNFKSYLRKMS